MITTTTTTIIIIIIMYILLVLSILLFILVAAVINISTPSGLRVEIGRSDRLFPPSIHVLSTSTTLMSSLLHLLSHHVLLPLSPLPFIPSPPQRSFISAPLHLISSHIYLLALPGASPCADGPDPPPGGPGRTDGGGCRSRSWGG